MQPIKMPLNEEEWAALTQKRLKRWKVSKESFLDDGALVIKSNKFGDWLRFVKRYGILIARDLSVPYATRVRLAGYTMVLAIRAKDELDFLRMVDEEVSSAANAPGIELP